MRLAYMGGTPISQSLAENIQFNSNTTLLDFDVLLWSPNFFIYTPYPIFIYDPNAQVFNLLDNFTVLRVKTSSSSGKRVEFRGDEIFAPFWEKHKNILEYQAVFDDVVGTPLFYIQGTQFVVGSYIKVKNGHISFLPAVNPNMNNQGDIQNALNDYVHTLIALDKELKKDSEDFELPDWSKSFALPHEYEQRGNFLQLEEELNAIKRKVNEKKRLIAELEKNKLLFTGTGKPLELQAKKVFEELGFTVTEGEPSN